MNERRVCTFKLDLGDRTMEASVAVPEAPLRVLDMLPLFLSFTEAITSAAAARSEAEGKPISCRAGCGACCRQLVPISETEARHVAAVVEEMPADRRERVKERFREAILEAERAGLLDELRNLTSIPSRDERRELGMRYFRAGIACPFLENESCGIHEQRPMSCREYLVTTPAGNCASPTGETIQIVPLAVKPSVVMYNFADGAGRDPSRHLPLLLALEWTEAHKEDAQATLPGIEMLENFLHQIRARMQ